MDANYASSDDAECECTQGLRLFLRDPAVLLQQDTLVNIDGYRHRVHDRTRCASDHHGSRRTGAHLAVTIAAGTPNRDERNEQYCTESEGAQLAARPEAASHIARQN